ncbi:MAG: hypothetical protein JWN80_3043 [Microbacteriaceae bacterium]|nr:hypothetical protein [Microbacteriaceae bacterium]
MRWATANDARGIATVHVASWQAAYRSLIADEVLEALNVDAREKIWSERFASGSAGPAAPQQILVAEAEGRIVGWASFGAGRDDGQAHLGELAALYAHPDFWSMRVGHSLITRVEDELPAAGFDDAYVWVLRGNDRAIRFYENHGWHSDGGEKIGEGGSVEGLHELRHTRQLVG